jgi:hypothetical protein
MAQQVEQKGLAELFVDGLKANVNRLTDNIAKDVSQKMDAVKQNLVEFRDETVNRIETGVKEGTAKHNKAVEEVRAKAQEVVDYCKMEAQFGCDVARKEVARQISKVASSTALVAPAIEIANLSENNRGLLLEMHQEQRSDLGKEFDTNARALLAKNVKGEISRKEFTEGFTATQDASTHGHFKLVADTTYTREIAENSQARLNLSTKNFTRSAMPTSTSSTTINTYIEEEIGTTFKEQRDTTTKFKSDVPSNVAKLAGATKADVVASQSSAPSATVIPLAVVDEPTEPVKAERVAKAKPTGKATKAKVEQEEKPKRVRKAKTEKPAE